MERPCGSGPFWAALHALNIVGQAGGQMTRPRQVGHARPARKAALADSCTRGSVSYSLGLVRAGRGPGFATRLR